MWKETSLTLTWGCLCVLFVIWAEFVAVLGEFFAWCHFAVSFFHHKRVTGRTAGLLVRVLETGFITLNCVTLCLSQLSSEICNRAKRSKEISRFTLNG